MGTANKSQSTSKVDALQMHLAAESQSVSMSVSVGGVGAIIDDHEEDSISQELGHNKKKSVLQDFGLITDMTELAHISRQYSSPTAPTPQSTHSRPSFTAGDSQRVSDK